MRGYLTHKIEMTRSLLSSALLMLAAMSAFAWPAEAEVFLKGNFIEIGIHNAGSFGTSGQQPAGFHGNVRGRLGFVADYGRDGWDVGSPPYAGGFFLPGSPEEGWMLEWTSPSGPERVFWNFGSMGLLRVPQTSLTDTSSGDTRSAIWEGTATSGSEALRVTQAVSFDVDDLFFVTNVTLTNVGTSTLHSVEYMRNVDPDQEQPWTRIFSTRNWVEFQPPRQSSGSRAALAARPAENSEKALAVAEGVTYGLTLGLGTIDSRAVVAASHGFANRDTDSVLNSPFQPVYGVPGSVYDRAIVLAYDLGDLAPGQSTSIDYVYVLNKEDLDVAMGNLGAVEILQPTGTISADGVIFQATTDDLENTTQIEFFVNGVSVGLDSSADAGGVFSVTFDSRPWPNGPVTLGAVATFAGGRAVEKTASVTADNAGPPIAFATPVSDQTFTAEAIPISIDLLDPTHPPVRISFFRETAGAGSVFLGEDAEPPYSAAFGVTGLPEGETVVIKAVGTDAFGHTTTVQVSGTVVVNTPPTADAGEDQIVEQEGPAGATVLLDGSGSSDPDSDPITYSWSGPFGTATGEAPTVLLPPGESTITLVVSDGRALSAADEVVVTVRDTTSPILAAPPDIFAEATEVLTPVALGTAAAYDAVDGALEPVPSMTGPFALGETVVVWTITDSAGNSASASQVVKVVDTTPPALSPPANVVVTAAGASTPATVGTATAYDIFGPVVISNNAPAVFPPGVTNVTWVATDANGNSTSAAQTVSVLFNFTGFAPPLKEGGSYKSGRTLPVKFQVLGTDGLPLDIVSARIQVLKLHDGEVVGDPLEINSTSAADSGLFFRYSDDQYIYNLSTAAILKGYYQITALLDDGSIHAISVGLKK